MMIDTHRTVLVLDDESAVRDQIGLLLSKEGCLLQVAGDLETAYRILAMDPPDVVLADLELENFDPAELAKILNAYNSQAKLILTTAFPNSTRGRAYASFPVLIKPFRETEVFDLVGSCREKVG